VYSPLRRGQAKCKTTHLFVELFPAIAVGCVQARGRGSGGGDADQPKHERAKAAEARRRRRRSEHAESRHHNHRHLLNSCSRRPRTDYLHTTLGSADDAARLRDLKRLQSMPRIEHDSRSSRSESSSHRLVRESQASPVSPLRPAVCILLRRRSGARSPPEFEPRGRRRDRRSDHPWVLGGGKVHFKWDGVERGDASSHATASSSDLKAEIFLLSSRS
jgi:hypothetical protein